MSRDPDYPPTPMLDKMIALGTRREHIQEFIDWLYDEQGWVIARWENYGGIEEFGGEFYAVFASREQVMARFFGIDLETVAREKEAVLAYVRRHQSA